jgi:hypothetical protein
MRGPSALRSLATCLVPSTASKGRTKIAVLKLGVPLVAVLLLGGPVPVYAQNAAVHTKPVLAHQRHAAVECPACLKLRRRGPLLSRTMVQPNGTPVNTGSRNRVYVRPQCGDRHMQLPEHDGGRVLQRHLH